MKLPCLLLCVAGWMQAQTPSDTQQLLNEVRELRRDLASLSSTLQRTQILMFRLQLEDAAVSHAAQRLDEARSRLAGMQARRKTQAEEIKGFEDELSRTQDPAQKARLPQMIAGLKKNIENWAPDEQDAQSRQIEAETQYRAEQARREALEAALEKIDQQLQVTVRQ